MQKMFYSIALSGMLLSTSTTYANPSQDENPCPPVKMFMAHTQFNTAKKIEGTWRVTDENSYQYNGLVWHSGVMIFDFDSETKTAEEAIRKAQTYLSKTPLNPPIPFRTCLYAQTDTYVIYADTGEMDGDE